MTVRKRRFVGGICAAYVAAGIAASAAPVQAQRGGPPAGDEPLYGSQLMTDQERLEHRQKMRTARSEEERERIRAEHHKQMQARARERGLSLPDDPPPRGGGMGPGPGPGAGPGGPRR